MDRRLQIHVLVAVLALLLRVPASHADASRNDWALTAYSVILSDDPLEEVLTAQADYQRDYQLVAMALSKQLPSNASAYDFEWELQLVKHVKGQQHYEINGLYGVRWYPLPWDNLIDTSLAVGFGLSYATEHPEFEAITHDKTAQLLGHIMLEAEFRPSSWKQWSLVIRSHHRSGAFGLFNDVRGASNSIGLGIKYRF